ncbi:hypothetical protein PM082_003586 [Marasmius tenuissimus]|nr:hypothetical protein PM082_003586 [Marasmius tenuissimus]
MHSLRGCLNHPIVSPQHDYRSLGCHSVSDEMAAIGPEERDAKRTACQLTVLRRRTRSGLLIMVKILSVLTALMPPHCLILNPLLDA